MPLIKAISAHERSLSVRESTFRSTRRLDQLAGRREATVISPSGGKAAFFPIKLNAYVNDQNVSGNLGYTRRIFIDKTP
jgi:hypothetical protein